MITYVCEGCGAEVHSFTMAKIPSHHFCLTCELLDNSHRHDLKEFLALYDRLNFRSPR